MKPTYVLRILLMVAVLLSGLSSCKSPKKVGAVTRESSAKMQSEFFEAMEEQAFRFNTMTARINVELKGTEKDMSSRVDLKMVKDSAFQLSFQPFLGIEMFRAEFTTDSVKIIDRMNKRYVAERYEDMKGQMPLELNFYNLQALFTNHIFLPGQQTISKEQFKRFRLIQEGATAELRIKDSFGLLYSFFADGEEKLLSTHITDSSERYALKWDYSDFRVTDGQVFPQLMNINILSHGISQGSVAMRFSHVQTDQPLALELSIPAKYKHITFAQILKSISNRDKQK